MPSPDGLTQVFLIGENFIGKDPVTLILGDNIFHGEEISVRLQQLSRQTTGATVFGYYIKDPKLYGVAGFDAQVTVTPLEEKPEKPSGCFW